MRQPAWLKRLGAMLRANRPLVKLPYSCALLSSNHTQRKGQIDQMNRFDQTNKFHAMRREWGLTPILVFGR